MVPRLYMNVRFFCVVSAIAVCVYTYRMLSLYEDILHIGCVGASVFLGPPRWGLFEGTRKGF